MIVTRLSQRMRIMFYVFVSHVLRVSMCILLFYQLCSMLEAVRPFVVQ